MTLTDTGPLVALVNRNDPYHTLCADAARRLPPEPLLTTWPCFTEAMYLVHRAGGYPAQEALWQLRTSRRLILHELSDAAVSRVMDVMSKYHDLPMDLADASLLAAAESLGKRQVFTLDRDFHVYRFTDGSAVEVIP